MNTNVKRRTYTYPVLLLLLPILLSGCSDAPTEPQPDHGSPLLEVVFRHTYALYAQSHFNFSFATFAQADTWVWEVDSDEELRDIDPQLSEKLGDLPLPLRPYSECNVGMGVSHPDFTRGGILLWVGSITVTSQSSVIVYAGWAGRDLGGARGLFELHWDSNRWKVVKQTGV
ncbi:MAG: hypothetical protein KFH87_00535 [Bacteroidetes bacterium]|nr:hypothetical protein [Bacteroidota bacterium]